MPRQLKREEVKALLQTPAGQLIKAAIKAEALLIAPELQELLAKTISEWGRTKQLPYIVVATAITGALGELLSFNIFDTLDHGAPKSIEPVREQLQLLLKNEMAKAVREVMLQADALIEQGSAIAKERN